jgi:hypothetical protein
VSARARLTWRSFHDDERGLTLAEIWMTVILLVLILGVSFSAMSSLTNAVAGTDRRVTNLNEARTLMAVTSKDLRTATRLQAGTAAFLTANANEVIFYANIGNSSGATSVVDAGPRKVRIYVDTSTRLIAEVTKPDSTSVAPNYTYVNGPTTVRYVGKYVANTASQPIFSYYDVNNVALTSTPLSAADRLAVRQVKITLAIKKTTTYQVGTTTLVNRVRLPNLDYQAVLNGGG